MWHTPGVLRYRTTLLWYMAVCSTPHHTTSPPVYHRRGKYSQTLTTTRGIARGTPHPLRICPIIITRRVVFYNYIYSPSPPLRRVVQSISSQTEHSSAQTLDSIRVLSSNNLALRIPKQGRDVEHVRVKNSRRVAKCPFHTPNKKIVYTSR